MNIQINDGGPAFPFGQVSELTGQPINGFFNPGMSLRDWFAGQALAGMLANADTELDPATLVQHMREGPWAIADAMLAARQQKGPTQ